MTNKVNNELDIEGNVQSEGDLNIGNTIERQIIINQGPSEQQLREIIRTEIELALKQNQILAEDKAREKLSNFSDKVLPKLVKSEMLDAFSDPTIQMFYRTAQQTAICSEREIDYDVLSELLVYRINNKGNIARKASITRAAEVLDKISDEALLAITIKYCSSFYPIAGDINTGLQVMDNLYKDILSGAKLPDKDECVDNAEILGVMRIESFSSMKKFEDIFFENTNGYWSKGIDMNSSLYEEVVNKLKSNNLPPNILGEHDFNPGYARLNIVNEDAINNIEINMVPVSGKGKVVITQKITDAQKQVLAEIFNLYKNEKDLDAQIKTAFVEKLKQYPYLKSVMEWWNSNLKPATILNSTGRVLAHTNAKRLVEDMPDMV